MKKIILVLGVLTAQFVSATYGRPNEDSGTAMSRATDESSTVPIGRFEPVSPSETEEQALNLEFEQHSLESTDSQPQVSRASSMSQQQNRTQSRTAELRESSDMLGNSTMALISSRFLAEREARFRAHLESVLKGITDGSITSEAAVISVGANHQESLALLRSSLNQGMEEELASREARIRRISEEKEHEIQVLQERLDTLLHASGNTSESFRIFDQARKHAEENVRRIREETEHGNSPELVTARQVNRTSKRFSEQLDDIRRAVQESRQTLEEAFENAQRTYADNIDSLMTTLRDRYDDILENITGRYNERQQRMEEAYRQQSELMQRMIDEITAANLRLEKEAELKDLINGVYRSNPDNEFIRSHSFILGSGEEIRSIGDLLSRRRQVEDIYNKVRLFSHLFGREDLGVEVPASNLEAVRLWLDRTTMDAILARYGNFPFSINVDNLFSDMSWEKTNTFNGSDLGRPLLNAKARLEGQIALLNGTNKSLVLSQLASIFQRNAADDAAEAKLTRPWHWRQHIYVLLYYKNGGQLGEYWQEFQGGYWGHSWGIFGTIPHHKGASHGMMGPWSAWQSTTKTQFKQDLDRTVDAIKNRAKRLFDFETNPDSPLQRLYQESDQINPSTINFPAAEIDALVRQCNDFVRKII